MRIIKKAIVLIFTLSTMGLFAQNHYVGIKAGANFTNVSSSEDFFKDATYRTGVACGMNYEYRFAKLFTVGADLLYSQKGYALKVLLTDEVGNPISEEKLNYNYDYISIPLKGGIYIGDKLSFFTNIGMVPSFLTSAKIKSPLFVQGENEHDIKNRVNGFDIAGLLELGGSLKFAGRLLVFVNASYEHSFTSLSTEKFFLDTKAKLYGFGAYAGIRFALKK